MKFGVVIFPGSNCDHDMLHVLSSVMGQDVIEIWHKDASLKDFNTSDWIMLPGGFSYGDYLRSGAIASFSPIMDAVKKFAYNGGHVFGVCNGFQVLCESDLLPGTLLHNVGQKFICKNIHLRVENNQTDLTSQMTNGEVLKIPIAHAEGRYYCNENTLNKLQVNNQILFTYCDENGQATDESNVNGSLNAIAGICNEAKNVFGMMPHPERAAEDILGNSDGKKFFESIVHGTLAPHLG